MYIRYRKYIFVAFIFCVFAHHLWSVRSEWYTVYHLVYLGLTVNILELNLLSNILFMQEQACSLPPPTKVGGGFVFAPVCLFVCL